jgi:hypothetical protein
MLDGVNAGEVPAGAAIYAGYVDGNWQSLTALTVAHPGALHVSICVSATGDARVLDVEKGDATPEQAPGWTERQRAAGNAYPVVYCNEKQSWPAVKTAFTAQGVEPPLYWVAAYVDDPTKVPAIPDGAIGLQYYDYGGYDASVVADYWPGLDPAPAPPAAAAPTVTTPKEQDDDMAQIEPLAVHPGEYAYAFAPDKTEMVLVADGYSNPAASVRIAMWGGDEPSVLESVEIGGISGQHTWGHPLGAGVTGVTVRRLDGQDYPIGVAFQ